MTAEAATRDIVIEYERAREDQAWARWLGRMVDSILIQPIVFVAFFAWGIGVEMGRLPAETLMWLDDPVLSPFIEILAVFLGLALWEPLFISNTGTTPGKFIMGVRVLRANGDKLSWWRAFQRFVQVWVVGMGLRIPVLVIILMLIARAKLTGEGITAWDQNLDCKVEHRRRHPAIWALTAFLAIGISAALVIMVRLAEQAP